MSRLALAAVASVALHAAVFAALAAAPTRPVPAPPTSAAPASPAWIAVEVRSSATNPPPPARKPQLAIPFHPPATAPTTAPAPTETQRPATAAASALPTVATVPAAPAADQAPGEVTPSSDRSAESTSLATGAMPSTSERPPASRPSPEVLATLHERLAVAARGCYPAAARRFRLRGEATLAFCVDGPSELRSLQLDASTGHPALDEAARRCVVQGALPLPVERGCYRVPIRFGD